MLPAFSDDLEKLYIARMPDSSVEVSAEISLRKLLRRQGYQLILNHSVLKPCSWFREAIMRGRTCYKHKFFGIPSWRCIQMSPSIYCNFQCIHCWRTNASDLPPEMRWKEIPDENYRWDDPEEIAEESIRVQKMIVQGYKGVSVFSKKMLEEAEDPRHAAISLTGEPTLYPHIGGLVEAYKRRGITTFIVTNGSMPDVIDKLSTEPTQLYITVNSPNRELFNKISRPLVQDAWEKVLKTLSLIKSLSSPVVMRITAIKGVNMHLTKEFARLIEKFEPTYVEPKGYSYVGYSRRRMSRENSPSHEEVRSFAEEIASLTSYKIIDEQRASKVVLLSRLDKPIRFY